jgi:cation diffusion facilitator family transporter
MSASAISHDRADDTGSLSGYTALMAAESRRAVIAAIVGNAAIAVIKFTAGTMTGSSAMISEGIHSLVDTGNGGLLFHGLRRGARPADDHHPFGHGMEVYFWSLIVAVSIFGIGGGMSIYEGMIHIRHPSPLGSPTINYIVLALSMVFESISFSVAWKAFRTTKGSRGTLAAIHHGKDPSMFAVLFEDSAALLGLVVAFFGVLLSHQLDAPVLDGLASIVIGLILVCAAGWLAYESKSLLMGEAADPQLVADVREIALADPAVTGLGVVLTMHLGPDEVLLNIEVQFTPGLPAEDIHTAVHRIEERINERYPEVTRIFVEVEALLASAARDRDTAGRRAGPSDHRGEGEPEP